ncbi:MAG: VWA domain-containing protein [Acidobacteriota bacterium]
MRLALLLLIPLAAAQDGPVIRASVTLVPLTVSIADKNGRPMDDIKASEITLFDNGRPREIRYFSRDFNAPLTIGLIADTSWSQRQFLAEHSETLKLFVGQVLRPADRGFLVSVSGTGGASDVQLVRDLTSSVEGLRAGIQGLRVGAQPTGQFGDACLTPRCRGTALWNSVYSSVDLRMKSTDGRKALIVLSDGIDTGSQHSLNTTIEAAQTADTPVYTIVTSGGLLLLPMRIRGGKALRKLAEETGGRAYGSVKDGSAGVFAQIEAELRNLYVLTFLVPENERDGKFHTLEVKTTRKGARVRSRRGYTAR